MTKADEPTDTNKPEVSDGAEEITTNTAETESIKANAAAEVETTVDQDAADTPEEDIDQPDAQTESFFDGPEPTEETVEATPHPATAEQKSGGSFFPMVLGGVLAAVIGFFAAEMDMLGSRSGELEQLRTTIASQQEDIAALKAAEPVVPEIDMPDLTPLEGALSELTQSLSDIEGRMAALEARPTVVSTDGSVDTSGFEIALQELRNAVTAQRSEIDALVEVAQSVERTNVVVSRETSAKAALAQITTALNDGEGFSRALGELRDSGIVEIPDALSSVSASGVPTLGALQADFADNARAALSAARAAGAQTGEDGFTGFVRRQLGARSVTPREGSDPDAVLSRAEAALRDGRLSETVDEIAALPDEAASVMSEWVAQARARADAQRAVQALYENLTAN